MDVRHGSAPEHDLATNIPCDLLLILARELDPEDYLNLSAVSRKIRNCLKTGKYSQAEIEDAKNFILQQKKKLKEMLEVVKKDPFAIKNFPNAPEKVKLAAVRGDGYAIEYINNPSEAVQLAAVSRHGTSILYIPNPSEAVKLAAVKWSGLVIQYIKNPSEAVKLTAVKRSWEALRYIDNPSDEMKKVAENSKKGYKAFLKASRGRKYAAGYNYN